MTELNQKNNEVFLELCKNVWDMSPESMEYLKNRVSDTWRPVPEFESLLSAPNATYEDQRVRIPLDFKSKDTLEYFASSDNAFGLFRRQFEAAISRAERLGTNITYKEFIDNKAVFRKNVTKIKKIFEAIYSEYPEDYRKDFCKSSYDKERAANDIVKAFEVIGASKKSAKNLQFVISFNAVDWFLASTSEKWSSCFNLGNTSGGYKFCLGLPFLAGDKSRCLIYITDGTKKSFEGMTVDSLSTRTWCILGDTDKFHIVKWYPNKTIDLGPCRSITHNNDIETSSTFNRSKYPFDVLSTTKGAWMSVYNDMGHDEVINGKLYLKNGDSGGSSIFSKDGLIRAESENSLGHLNNPSCIDRSLGYNISNWRKFGYHLDLMFPSRRCNSCGEDKFGIESREEFICFNCFSEKYFKCDNCGSTHERGKSHNIVTSDLQPLNLTVCEDCYEEFNNRKCSICGGLSSNNKRTYGDDTIICPTCLERGANGYGTCECGKITKNIKVRFNTFDNSTITECPSCTGETNPIHRVATFGRDYSIIFGTRGRNVE